MGEFPPGLGESTDSVSLPEFMSFSIIHRSSNKASRSTSPVPVHKIQIFSYQYSTVTLINYKQSVIEANLFHHAISF